MKHNVQFPLKRAQAGFPLGNSRIGILAWGEKNLLNLTFGCQSLWDHRGGFEWTSKQNFFDLAAALKQFDKNKVDEMFTSETQNRPNYPKSPSIIPVGRLEIQLPAKQILQDGTLNLSTGKLIIKTSGGKMEIVLAYTQDIFGVKADFPFKYRLIPAWDLTCGLQKIGFTAPEKNDDYFIQPMPEDSAYGVKIQSESACQLSGVFFRNEVPALKTNFTKIEADSRNFLRKTYKRLPKIQLDNPFLQRLYEFNRFKFISMTDTSGVPGTLQGPWLDDDKMPMWSSDYHFNINVEMCYSPALPLNMAPNIKHLFDMVLSWRPILRRNAKGYVGIDDGYMLPHAVDDRCTCMGLFWTGSIDHACTMWIADMMFNYVCYTNDINFLKDSVFDFMHGAMQVVKATLDMSGEVWSLPVGVSPEYREAKINAWGKNSTFQLAAIHRLNRNLIEASLKLNLEVDPFYLDLAKKLPAASIVETNGQKELALWENTKLDVSHRHHSHLAGITPLDIFDFDDPETRQLLRNTFDQWVLLGTGMWTGWSMPWAAQINCALGNGDMAEILLEIWGKAFNNENNASLHDAVVLGYTYFALLERGEIMQIDGAMGFLGAICQMLVPRNLGVLKLGGGIPSKWRNTKFKNLAVPGGFISAEFSNGGKVNSFSVTANQDYRFRIALTEPEKRLEFVLKKGETFNY